jgi:hypothetical protein
MTGLQSYLDAYVDRRMSAVIEEWDLSRQRDIANFIHRLDAIEHDIAEQKNVGGTASDTITTLENRAKLIQGRI